MKFTTPIPSKPQEPKIDYSSKIFLVGSCFVDNIGEKLDYYKLQNYRNPFGILYHPQGIENLISKTVDSYVYSSDDIFYNNEQWQCFDAHSSLNNSDENDLVTTLNRNLRETKNYIEQSTHIIITLGTSWIYTKVKSGEAVANCHKLPQKNFSKEITSVPNIENILNSIISKITSLNHKAKIIFTVSPVRHLKDGAVENQQSKAHLIAAVHKVIRAHANSAYFPAYEIMMDELRDYRFYAEDMLHPNTTAINYIWEKFVDTWFSIASEAIRKEVDLIQKSLRHRPFNENSKAHKVFLVKLQKKIAVLKRTHSYMNFD